MNLFWKLEDQIELLLKIRGLNKKNRKSNLNNKLKETKTNLILKETKKLIKWIKAIFKALMHTLSLKYSA